LAQDWQILGVDPEVAQERGSRRLDQDFFRLISNVPQSVAAQGAPAFWLLLGDSDNGVLDTLVRGLLTLC
jgi:hypothetical protein